MDDAKLTPYLAGPARDEIPDELCDTVRQANKRSVPACQAGCSASNGATPQTFVWPRHITTLADIARMRFRARGVSLSKF